MSLKTNNSNINWENSDSYYFFNPLQKHNESLKKLAKKLPFFPKHIYLFTSNFGKICLLSKRAFLSSAKAVNKNLNVQVKDKWLVCLPLFHVAGLSVLARSFCGGFSYERFSSPWEPKLFKKELERKNITLCSLVPSQVYDLIKKDLKAPKKLRAILVGGGALSPLLYKKAKMLSWPLLPSYGLTEASSQVACASLESLSKKDFPKMKLLDHIQIQKEKNSIKIKSLSLLTAYFDPKRKKLYDPKSTDGWLELPDEIVLEKNSLTILGRKDEVIKILGEKVDLQKLSFLLENLSQKLVQKCQLLAIPHSRQGFKLSLLTSSFEIPKVLLLIKKFNKKVLSFEKIQSLYFVNKIRKNPLFKVNQKDLKKQIAIF